MYNSILDTCLVSYHHLREVLVCECEYQMREARDPQNELGTNKQLHPEGEDHGNTHIAYLFRLPVFVDIFRLRDNIGSTKLVYR